MGNVLILGTFDGVHIGHRALLEKGKEVCNGNDTPIAVLFTNHPAEVLGKNVSLIDAKDEREKKINNMGVICRYVDFNEHTAAISPKEYIEYLCEKFSPIAIVVGRNHTFGKNAQGTPRDLIKFSADFGYRVFIQPSIVYQDEIVSSTKIRKCINDGNIDKTTEMLGQYFSFAGEVVHGRNVGSKMGIPTANILYPSKKVRLANGVYCAIVHIDNFKYACVMNIGTKPTFGDDLGNSVECFVLGGYQGDLYGKTLKVDVVKRIRDEKKFNSVDDLKKQIFNDIAITISYFKVYCHDIKY